MLLTHCYECVRKQLRDQNEYYRLQSYFNALEQDKLDRYHDKHGRKQNK